MSEQSGGAIHRPALVDDDALERSAVVANIAMNRVRGLAGVNSYERELGFDPFQWLAGRAARPIAWLDVCCGSGRALLEAERRFADELPDAQVAIVGVDLVDFFAAQPCSPRLAFIAQSAASFQPDRAFDLVTCVHGLHYVGDKLDLISRLVSFLAPDGRLAADFDPESIRTADGASAARRVLNQLRLSDIDYDRRRHRLTCLGPRTVSFPATYRGADDLAGPGYTGQPSVSSHYQWS